METPTTTYEIRRPDGNWYELHSGFFWSQQQGLSVLMYYLPDDYTVALEQHELERGLDEGTVRAAHVEPCNNSASEYISPEAARRMINEAGREHTLVVRFDKADGSARRMVCRYTGATSPDPWHMTVWDEEKDDWRQVDTRTCRTIRVLSNQKAA